jgi:hypothetical protein
MHKPILSAVFVAVILLAASCSRPTQPAVVRNYLSIPALPYDTTGLNGIFIVRQTYQQDLDHVSMDGYARFCKLPGSPQALYANAGVMGSGWETTDHDNGFKSEKVVNFVSYLNDTTVWLVSEQKTNVQYYIDSSFYPYMRYSAPDTVAKSIGFTFHLDSLANADTMLFYAGDLTDGSRKIENYFSSKANNIAVSFASPDFSAGSLAYIGTIAFRHKYVTINGAKYLFVKEYEVKRSLWLK